MMYSRRFSVGISRLWVWGLSLARKCAAHPYPQRAFLAGLAVELLKIVSYCATAIGRMASPRSPLELAAAIGNLDLVNLVLLAGANGSSAGWRGRRGQTLLDAAALRGNGAVITALVGAGAGADVNVVSVSSGIPALHTATLLGHEAAAKQLILAGADVNLNLKKKDPDIIHGATPLHAAALFGYVGIVSSLLLAEADKDALNSFGETPLMSAVEKDQLVVVETLLAAGADHSIQTTSGSTALHYAAWRGHDQALAALLRNGADKNALANDGETPLMRAARNGQLTTVETLLVAGADHSIQTTSYGSTALHFAAWNGHDQALAALLRNGADKNALANDGETPLMRAARSGQLTTVETLLVAGVDITIRTTGDYHLSAFDTAAVHGHAHVVEAFLRHGEDASAFSDETGMSALHHACYDQPEGLLGVVDLLLRHGVDETALDNDGESPVDKFDIPLEEDEDEPYPPRCAQDEVELARLLLARAPADRAWRRRSWLVMLRSRAQFSKADGTWQNKDGAVKGEVGAALGACCDRQDREEGGDVGELDHSQDRADWTTDGGSRSGGEYGSGSGSGGGGGGGGGQENMALLSDVVAILVELASEDIFRLAVGFL